MREAMKKRLIKTAIYKLCSFMITFVIALALSRKMWLSAQIGILEVLASTIFYYFYEIFWERR